jgi:putative polyketide hydroxylase
VTKAYGITPDGASLVRPDFVVAWRTQDSSGDLRRVLDEILSRV